MKNNREFFFTIYSCPSHTSLREKNIFSYALLRIRQELFLKHKVLAYSLAKTQSILVKVFNTTYVDHHWRQDIWIALVCYNLVWCEGILRSKNIILDFGIHQEVYLNNSWLIAWLLIMIDSIDTHQVDHVEGFWYCMFIFCCTILIIL